MHEPDHGLAARRAYEELPRGKPAGCEIKLVFRRAARGLCLLKK
jgi:hypothetical protein